MGLVPFRYQHSSYTKLPFPPNLLLLVRRGRTCRVHVGPTASSSGGICKEKVVVVVGATGCGKSNLSVDLATRLGPPPVPAEIINSDKMQLHRGLHVTTNKIPFPDRRGVPHHLLGCFDPARDVPPSDFRVAAGNLVSGLNSSGKLPIVAGGSNSLVHALLVEDGSTQRLRYDCCFLWVDVAPATLDRYLRVRVDEMLESGMFDELDRFFAEPGPELRPGVGIMRAIGVPEFEGYFRKYPPGRRRRKEEEYKRAVNEIKENTCRLARRQVEKIQRLRDIDGWDLHRIDATASLEAKMERRRWASVWEKDVVEPSVVIVRRFLENKIK